MADEKPFDIEKLRSIRVGKRTRDRVSEGRDADTGERWKATTDELNNTVTQRSGRSPSGVDERQDVQLRPQTLRQKFSLNGDN